MGGKIFEQREEEREEDFVSFLSRLAVDRNLDDEIFSLPSPRALRELFIRSRHRT